MQYYVHAASGYIRQNVIDVPFQRANITPGQVVWNKKTFPVRMRVECSYMEVKLYWTAIEFKRNMTVSESKIGLL